VAQVYDRGQWFDREVPQAEGRLKRTSFGGVIFDGLRALSIELYENSGFVDLIPDTYSYFKLLGENKSAVKDFEEFDAGVKRYAVRITSDNKLTPYDFPNGKWGRDMNIGFNVTHTSTAVLGNTQSGLYLVAESGEIYNYQPQNQRITAIGQNWPAEAQEIIVYNGQNLVLNSKGQIMVLQSGALVPWTETNNVYSDLIATPMYDGFEVRKE
jgi:hypothetical protein